MIILLFVQLLAGNVFNTYFINWFANVYMKLSYLQS